MKNSTNSSLTRCARLGAGLLMALAVSASIALVDLAAQSGQVPIPIPGRNINMISGTNFPGGDPFLQRQNEPSIAVSTRNPLHLLGSANDYRTVDIPGLGEAVNGDAWISVFKSFDGGNTWKSTLLPGFRQDVSPDGRKSPLYGLEAGADPVIRAGTNGMFYLGGMAFNRNQDAGKVFVARYIDNNNLEAGDSIAYLGTTVVDIGSEYRFLDKPWIAVDIPRAMKGRGRSDADDRSDRAKQKDKKDKDFDPKKPNPATNPGLATKPTTGPVCQIPGQAQPIPAGNIYVVYSAFLEPLVKDPRKPNRKGKELEGLGKHKQGVPMEGRTKIMLSRSTDCGETFSRPQQISERSQINQSAVAAIDPSTGALYVAWREFLSNAQPDAILVTRSTNGGKTFSSPITIATISPFDQGTTPTSFRTNSYPAMTIDGTGRVYVAWAQRGVGMGGDARIVISTSADGRTWSAPVAADNPPQRGHQIMPVLNFGGGKLHLVFWDQRDDVSKLWGQYIDDFTAVNWTGPPSQRPKRHTLDLRAVAGWPGAPPAWGPSAKISNYLEGVRAGQAAPEQLQFNAPNLPLFSLGTKPFIGDYLDVTMSPSFLSNGDGTWRFNTLASDPATFFTAWGDNRDVRAPRDGNWVHYTAPTFAGYTGTSIFDPTQPVEVCQPGQAGMRDQNVYSARVSSGLIMSTLGNNKPLGFVTDLDGTRRLIQRSFVITVTNPENLVKSVVLHINSQPPGGRASFLQFEPLLDLPVDIAAKSSISREVFVTSTDPRAAVPITVTEGTSANAAGRVYLNPDRTNPDIDNPDIDNPDIDNPDIDNAEAHAITVSNAVVSNPDIDNTARANPDIDNPDIDNPDIDNSLLANPSIINPDIDNPDIENPDIDNPNIINPDIENPDIENPDIENAALTDVTWNVSNVGNTATAYQIKLLLKQAQQQRLLNAGVKFQLVISKTTAAPAIDKCAVVQPNRNLTVVNINRPSFVDPSSAQQISSVINPDIENPDIDNATMALAPGETARVTLRIYSPLGDTTVGDGGTPAGNPLEDLTGALEDLRNVGVATTSYPVDTEDVIAGETTPQIEASIPLIVTETLDDATRGLAYGEVIDQTGSTAPFSFAVTTGSLPPGLSLAANGAITGTPTLAGVFTFTVALSDANDMSATATLTIRVFEPVVVVGGALPATSVNQASVASLAATGGFAPYSWSLASGALPTGVSLSPAGVVSGTPSQSGTFGFTAMATDVASPTRFATGAFQLSVAAGANAQTVTVVEDTATPITLSATGGGPFSFVVGNSPAHGTLTGTGPTFSYTPALGYNGPDSFTFSVSQGSVTSGFATVSINVTPVNDPPVAAPLTLNTPQGVALPVVLAGSDAENTPLTFSIVSGPTAGTLSGTAPNLTYTPPVGFTGNATFTYRANDGTVFSPVATATVIVGPPPAGSADVTLALLDSPDPVALGGTITYSATIHNNGPAVATAVSVSLSYPAADLLLQSVTTPQGTCTTANPIVCTVGSIAAGGDVPVTLVLKAFNRGGSVMVSGAVTSAPLDYNTSNNSASQATVVTGPGVATTDLQVTQARAPGPVAFGSNVVYTIVVTNNGPSDATGVSLANTFTTATAMFVSATSSQGACTAGAGQVSCTTGSLINGASASYTITLQARGSGSLSNTASVSGSQSDPAAGNNSNPLATVIENRPPTASSDVATINEDTAAALTVLGNDTDPDGDTLSITSVTPPLHGMAQVTGNAISYTPVGDYNGPDSVTYTINDGNGGTSSGTVLVSVLSVNDAPDFVAGPNQAIGLGAGPQTVANWATAIRAGAANEIGQTLNFIVSNNNRDLFSRQPAIAPNGTLSYTLTPTGQGSATVTVVLQDDGDTANGGVDSTAPRTFTITTTMGNVPPSFTAGPNVTTTEDAGAFVAVNNEGGARATHTATRLSDGRVLIAGGTTNTEHLASAQLYDPATRTQVPTGAMAEGRVFHSATLLANNLVLIVGGSNTVHLASAELYNPASGEFSATGSLNATRHGHIAARLPSGRVLIAGGLGLNDQPVATAEIFDPATNTFSPTGGLAAARTAPTAVPLADGRVLVVGGWGTTGANLATAEIYDEVTGVFTSAGSMGSARLGAQGILLPSNLALIAGGSDDVNLLSSSELFDPSTGQFTPGPDMTAPRFGFAAELLADGTVLFAGGRSGSIAAVEYVASAESYNPATNVFAATSSLATARTNLRLTRLADGSVLVTGGFNADIIVGASELYLAPGPQVIPGWATAISAGPAHESGQVLDFIVTNDNSALFIEQPTIDPAGRLSFRSAAQANGSATVTVRLHDNGGIADGGADTSAPQTFVINVAAVNDAPSFSKGGDYTVPEDGGPQFVPGWATALSVGPVDETGQGSDFVVSTNNAGLFAGVPAIDSDTRTLTFTPAANAYGNAIVSVYLHDSGGTTNGGVNVSAVQTFVITVTPVNDSPGFNPLPGLYQVPVNAGPQTVPGWVTGISAGPANENAQSVVFLVTNENNAFFNAQPAIAPDGTLTFTVATGATGGATVTVRARDNGGTANDGNDTSLPQEFLIALTQSQDADLAVTQTDAPDAAPPGGNFTYTMRIENLGPGTATGVVLTQDISANLAFVGINGDATCDIGPSTRFTCLTSPIDSGGIRTVVATVRGPFGSGQSIATVSASQVDPNPANNTATEQTTIDHYPVAANDSVETASGVAIDVDVLANDTDPDISSGDVVRVFTVGGAQHGTVTHSTGTRILRYTPVPGYTGADTFSYTVADSNTLTSTAIVTVLVTEAICTAEPAALISWWQGEGDATDIRGGNTGTTFDRVSFAPGMVGQAFALDGSPGPGVLVPDSPNLGPSAITLAAWVRPASNAVQSVISKAGSFALGVNDNAQATCSVGDVVNLLGGSVQVAEWSHVVCTFDGNSAHLYVNGVQVAQASNDTDIPDNTSSVAIGGGDPANPGREFGGLIDEVQVFGRALSQAEIASIVSAGDAGVCFDRPVVAADDVATTITNTPLTFSPNANDLDPDAGFPSVLATVRAAPTGSPVLTGAGDLAIVQSTGLGYMSGGVNVAAGLGVIGILDTNTDTLIGSMTLPVPNAQSLSKVNQATGIVYMRGTTLTAVDGRPSSPTFNQVSLSLALGNIQSMAIDELRGRLYLTSTTPATARSLSQSRIIVLDADPSSPTFHQVLNQLQAPGGGTALSVGVDTVANKIYVAVNGGSATGVYAMDGVTHALTLIPLTTNPSSLVVNASSNLVYAVTGTSLYAIDGGTNARLALITLPAGGSAGNLDTRLAVHNATGHVYVRLSEFPGNSRLAVIDGNRSSAAFNTILTLLPIGREDGQTMVSVDQTANRVITTSRSDLRTTIIDALSHEILSSIQSTQPSLRITLDRAHNRAYVGGGTILRSINLMTGVQQVITVGPEMAYVAVDPISHTGFVSQTVTGAAVARVNQDGLIGTVALPHSDGRQVFTARNSVTNRIYSLNTASTVAGGSDGLPGFVRVVDGFTNTLIASVPVGPFPFAIGIDDTRNKIYVGNGSDGAAFPGGISVIDGVDHSVVQADFSRIPATSTTPGQFSVARDIAPNPTTGKVYFRITSGSTTQFGVLDSATNVATPFPDAEGSQINIIRVNPVMNRIYVGEQFATGEAGMIHVITGANDEVIASVTAGSPSPFIGTQSYLAVNRTTGRVFVADYNNDSLTVIDGNTNAVVATVKVGDGPGTVAVNHALNRIYVGNALDKTLTVIDGATLRVAATLTLPLAPVWLELDETVSQVYAIGSGTEPGVMVIADPGTTAPGIASVTDGASGTVTLNADGSVTYTPNNGFAGADSFTYQVPDGSGGFTTGTVNVTVTAPLTMTPATLPDTTAGTPFLQSMAAAGGTGPYSWSISLNQLPGGLSLNGITGVIAGTAVQSGTFTFSVQVRDSSTPNRTAVQSYTINVGPPVIATTGLPNGFVGAPYSAAVVVGGATGEVQWTLDTGGSPLLAWLTISSAGVLSGTPPNPGTTPPFTVRATDSLAQVALRSYTMTVGAPLDISPTQLREGVVLETQASLPLVGGNGTRAVTLTDGTLPPGLTLNANGTFTGTPRRHGTFNFTVQATDCTPATTCLNTVTQQTVTRQLTLRVSAKEQQGASQTQPAITFGGPGGRRVAQVVTAGAQGTLTGIGLQNISCPSFGPVTIDIQRLTENGLPDGTTIATGTSVNSLFGAISVAPAVDLPIGAQFAFIVNSPTACTLTNAGVTDLYNAGDAYTDTGSGWVSLFSTDGRYDVPSFRTLIQPAMEVGYLSNSRNAGSTATLLSNGTVLLTGTGASAEIYDPATNATTVTGSMSTARSQHTATLLQDGTVLIAGGQAGGVRIASAETYDPNTGTFSLTSGSMSVGRDVHAATRMNDGRVLITGGNINVGTSSQAVASADIYDPVSRTFTAAPNMTSTRQVHNSILLQSGKVLIASGFIGGSSSRSAEVYDPVTNTFTATVGNMSTARGWSAAELLTDGRVLISGGQSGPIRNTAEIYDPITDTFTTVGSMATARQQHTLTRLADGSVLVAGGFDEATVASYVLPLASMERFIPATNSFVPAGGMEARRARHNSIRLPNDTIFHSGGAGQSWMSANTGEIYSTATRPGLTTTMLPDGQIGVAYPVTTLAATGGSGSPYQIALASGQLPPGLTLDASFTLSGTPTVNGAFPIGIRVSDSLNHSTVEALTVRVGAPLVITSPYQLTSGVLNHSYDVQLTASDPAVWSLSPASGLMPAGLALTTDGRITGMLTDVVGRTFMVRAVDASGRLAQKTFNISIQNPLAITTTVLPEAAVRETYNFCLSSSNGVTANSWSISGGSLPPGVTLPSNCFNNPPTALGTYNFTVSVTDLASPPQVVTRDFTIRVSAKEQQGGSQTQPTITFGGAGGRRLAQTITVGASGTLTGFGFNTSITCQAPVTVDVQRLSQQGLPDGTTIASGNLLQGLGGIPISPALDFGIGERIAFVLSSPSACTLSNVPATDSYQAGEGLSDAGSGWVSLVDSDGRYDIPFRSMIQPSSPVVFMHRSRGSFEATTLSDGRVLMTGHGNTAEIYDPVTSTTALTSNMNTARVSHTGTLLPDGTVLIAGGRDSNNNRLATAEIFNPATGTFAVTSGPMSVPHEEHTATLMNDGRVLIAGGLTQVGSVYQSIATAEIYDPSTMTFSPAGSMLSARHVHTAALLASGRILLIGGFINGMFVSAELYDPITGTFTATAGGMFQTRGRAAAARLPDGRVFITGGQTNDIVNTAEIYDPVTDSFAQTGSMASPRQEHTATVLADGSVLVAGGVNQSTSADYILPLATMERWVPGSNTFVPAGSLVAGHRLHTATRLPGGSVLIAGGFSQGWMTGNTAEIFDPAVALALSPAALPDATPGTAYTGVTFAVSGGTGPRNVEMVSGALPPGLSYNPATLTLSGTPATAGVFMFGFRVTDSASHSMVQSFTLRVGSLNTITNPYRLIDAPLGVSYAVQLAATGASPITWYAGPPSNLPPGLVMSSSGLISGTPTTQSYYNFAVRAVDVNGQSTIKTLSINVSNPLAFATTAVPVAAILETYTYCLSTNGGVGTLAFAVSGGGLPPGVTLQTNGCFASSPTAIGDFGITVRASDQSPVPQVVTRSFSIRVSAREQQGSSQAGTTITFGGPGGRRLAQTFTAAANGFLTAVGSSNVFCSAVAAQIQGVRNDGLPDGVTLATGSFQSNLTAITGIPMTPAIPVTIGSRFAIVFSSATLCDVTNAPFTFDGYFAGDGFSDSGGGWELLTVTDGKTDIPSFRTLIQPAVDVAYLRQFRASHSATPLADQRLLLLSQGSSAAELLNPATNASAFTGSLTAARSGYTATPLADGTVLVVGGQIFTTTTVYQSSAEIFNPATGTFTLAAGSMSVPRSNHSAVRLSDGRVLIMGGFGPSSWRSAELYDPATQTFSLVGDLSVFRNSASATLLNDGTVLVVGGGPTSAELFNPGTLMFSPVGNTVAPRFSGYTTTLLADGRVLLVGGADSVSPSVRNSAELYDPGTGTFTATGNLIVPRQFHAAVRLADGSVLISGGRSLQNAPRPLATMERYVPASGTFVPAGAMATQRQSHTATPITGGRVVLAGGSSVGWLSSQSAEVYDPSTALALNSVPLPDAAVGASYAGVIFGVTGGSGGYTMSIESGSLPPGLTFNPATFALGVNQTPLAAGVYTFGMRLTDSLGHSTLEPVTLRVSPLDITTLVLPAPTLATPYSFTLGATGVGPVTWSILIGALPPGLSLVGNTITGTPASVVSSSFTLRAVDSVGQTVKQSFFLAVAAPPVDQQSGSQAGTAISFGGAGGRRLAQTVTAAANATLAGIGSFNIVCPASTAVTFEIQGVANDGTPDGVTMATGTATGTFSGIGIAPFLPMMIGSRFAIVMNSSVACDVTSAASTFDGYVAGDGYAETGGGWALLTASDGRTDLPFRSLVQPAVDVALLRTSRSSHMATRLDSGRILLISNGSAEVFDPATRTSVQTGAMAFTRSNFTATLLANGTVLVAGGQTFSTTTTYQSSAEIFDPATGTFTLATGAMSVARSAHSAVRLPDGRVLITGGFGPTTWQSAEIYDPATQTFGVVGNMMTWRQGHTSVLLADGNVLVAGGFSSQVSAEIYDTATGTFTATTGGMQEPRLSGFTATLLANGRVLFTGGAGTASPDVRHTAEIFNPATRTFTATGHLSSARQFHAAALLPDGSVLISGGRSRQNAIRPLSTMERYLPASGTFVPAGGMATQRNFHTATLTSDGRVLVAGGTGGASLASTTAEFFDPATAVSLTGVPLPEAEIDVAYPGVVLGATGGSGAPYTIVLESGALPPGLTYNAGTFALGVGETPTAVGAFTAGMRVTDSAGHTRLEPLTLRVSPLDITTTILPQPTQNQPYSFTLGATGVGSVTWSVYVGSLPSGLSLVGNTITGTPTTSTGTSFTLLATDSAGQRVKQSYSLVVQLPPADQQSSWDVGQAPLVFGGATRVGQRVRTGITGSLFAARASNLLCPAGTMVTAEIQGHLPSGAPDGVTIASGTATASTFAPIPLSPQIFFAAEAQFALVFSTDQQCQLFPTSFDSYAGGEAFVTTPQWQRLIDMDGRHDIPFLTYVQPVAPLRLMTNWRGDHTATTLADGKVLLVSGSEAVAEVYDPATGTFATTGNLRAPRNAHRASLLANGTVLVTGGFNYTGPGNAFVIQNTAEIFHPDTLTFEMLPATMPSGRYNHSSTTLVNGMVLIAGGSGGAEQSGQLYDPITRIFTPTANLLAPRAEHTATRLADGRVLLHGGYGGFQSEIFDPATSTFTTTATPVVSYRNRHSATLLPDGTVLIAGGSGSAAGTTAEVFNPVSGAFTAVGTMQKPRVEHTAALLSDGSVLVAGGYDDTGTCCLFAPHSSLERYVPGTGFVGAGSMQVARYQHTASSLPDGTTMLAGTYGWSSIGGRTTEIYDPATAVALVSVAAPDGHTGAAYAGFTLIGSGGGGIPYTIVQRSGRLPNGLTYDGNSRTISGTPQESGTFTMTFTVSDGFGNANSQTLTVRIDPLTVTTASLPGAQLGSPYNAQLTATGLAPVTWSLIPGSALPGGLTLNPDGTIIGTPSTLQSAWFTVRATDTVGQVAQRQMFINVFNP